MKKRVLIGLIITLVISSILLVVHVNFEADEDKWYLSYISISNCIKKDFIMNPDIIYIALDFSDNVELKVKDKARIIENLNSQYSVDVFESDNEGLQSIGLIENDHFINGVLISVDSIETMFLSVKVKGKKFEGLENEELYEATIIYTGINKWNFTKILTSNIK